MAIERQPKANVVPEVKLEKTANFLKEVQTELKKTTWPTRQEALRLTYVVIGIIIVLGIYMASLDFILNTIFNKVYHK